MQKQQLQMRVTIVFPVWRCLQSGARWGEIFQPLADILDKFALEIIREYGSRNAHGRDRAKATLQAAMLNNPLNLIRDLHHLAERLSLKDQVLRVALYPGSPGRRCIDDKLTVYCELPIAQGTIQILHRTYREGT